MSVDSAVSQPGKARFFYGYIIVIASFLIMAVMWGSFHAFGVFLNPLLVEFGWSRAMISGALSLALLVSGFSAILMGKLTDVIGPRWVLIITGVLGGVGYILVSLVGAVWELYLFYGIFIGIAMGGSWVPLMSTIARWFSARRSTMTGIALAGLGIGGLVAPPAANLLISARDWRESYLIIGIILLVVVVLAGLFLRRDPTEKNQRPYGADKIKEQKTSATPEGLSFQQAMGTWRFWRFFFTLFCFGLTLYAIMGHIRQHAIDLKFSEASGANILALIGGLGIIGMITLGNSGDKIGNRAVAVTGLAIMSVALLWLITISQEWMLYVFSAVFGYGHGGFASSESPLAAKLFGLKAHGTILGTAVLGFSVGAAIGPEVMGYIFDSTGSYQIAFVLAAAVGIIGVILATTLKPAKQVVSN